MLPAYAYSTAPQNNQEVVLLDTTLWEPGNPSAQYLALKGFEQFSMFVVNAAAGTVKIYVDPATRGANYSLGWSWVVPAWVDGDALSHGYSTCISASGHIKVTWTSAANVAQAYFRAGMMFSKQRSLGTV